MSLENKTGLKGCGCLIIGTALIAGCTAITTYKYHNKIQNAVQSAKEVKEYFLERKLPAPEPSWSEYYRGFPEQLKKTYTLYDAETIGKALRALPPERRERLLDFIIPKTNPNRKYLQDYPYGGE